MSDWVSHTVVMQIFAHYQSIVCTVCGCVCHCLGFSQTLAVLKMGATLLRNLSVPTNIFFFDTTLKKTWVLLHTATHFNFSQPEKPQAVEGSDSLYAPFLITSCVPASVALFSSLQRFWSPHRPTHSRWASSNELVLGDDSGSPGPGPKSQLWKRQKERN